MMFVSGFLRVFHPVAHHLLEMGDAFVTQRLFWTSMRYRDSEVQMR